MTHSLIEFPDDGLERLEVRSLHGILRPAPPDDDSKLVTRTVALLERRPEVRLDSVLQFLVDLCIKQQVHTLITLWMTWEQRSRCWPKMIRVKCWLLCRHSVSKFCSVDHCWPKNNLHQVRFLSPMFINRDNIWQHWRFMTVLRPKGRAALNKSLVYDPLCRASESSPYGEIYIVDVRAWFAGNHQFPCLRHIEQDHKYYNYRK